MGRCLAYQSTRYKVLALIIIKQYLFSKVVITILPRSVGEIVFVLGVWVIGVSVESDFSCLS